MMTTWARVGGGTSPGVSMGLPVQAEAKGVEEPAGDRKAVGGEPPPTLHLLIVDGDDAVRSACSEIAAKMGFAVVSARDMVSAQAILKHRKVDLLLLDVKIPGDEGLNLLEEVKTLYPDTVVIVMTAFATVANAVEAMRWAREIT